MRSIGSLRPLGDVGRDADLELHLEQAVAQLRQRDHLHVLAEGHPVGLDQIGPRSRLLQRVEHSVLGGDDEAAVRVLFDVLQHPRGGEHVDALGIDVAGGDVLHRLGGAAALGVDQELGLGVLGPGLGDVAGADAGVDVALAVPDVEAGAPLGIVVQAGLALDEGAQPHVRPEEDLRLRPVLGPDVLDHLDRVGGGAAVVGLGLHLGRGVDVHDHQRPGVLGLPGAQLVGVDRVGKRATGVEVGDQDGLLGREDRGRLGHEVDAAEGDRVGLGRGRLAREAERVAHVVGDVLDLGQLVVVGEDHRVALGRERSHLIAQGTDLLRREVRRHRGLDRGQLLHLEPSVSDVRWHGH